MLYFCYRFNIIWWNKSIDSLVNYFFHSNWQSISNSTFQDSLRSLVRLRLEGVFLQTLSGCWLWFRFDFNFKLSRLAFLTVKNCILNITHPSSNYSPTNNPSLTPLPHGQTDRHTNSIQNELPHYPMQVQGEFFVNPIFLYLSNVANQRSRKFMMENFFIRYGLGANLFFLTWKPNAKSHPKRFYLKSSNSCCQSLTPKFL